MLKQYSHEYSDHLGLDMRRPVKVCHQVTLKMLCEASIDILLSREQITKELISLTGCTGWPAPLLFASNKIWYSCGRAHLRPNKIKSVFWVTGLKSLSRVGINVFFGKKHNCMHFERHSAFFRKPGNILGFTSKFR